MVIVSFRRCRRLSVIGVLPERDLLDRIGTGAGRRGHRGPEDGPRGVLAVELLKSPLVPAALLAVLVVDDVDDLGVDVARAAVEGDRRRDIDLEVAEPDQVVNSDRLALSPPRHRLHLGELDVVFYSVLENLLNA